MSGQLSLAISLRDDATFANFLATDTVRAQAKAMVGSSGDSASHLYYIWGGRGSGVRHFAQAACHELSLKRNTQYLPLADLVAYDPDEVLDGLGYFDVVCLEGIQAVAGYPEWERGLFGLYNQMVDRGQMLLVTADAAPSSLALSLPDLVSRLSCGITFHFSPYDDSAKQQILKFRAAALGIDMADEVAGYIIGRSSRHLADLMNVLQRLDAASLEAKRRVTLPFVKATLGW